MPQTGGTITIAGCLKAEKDVPGLTPDVAERAGMGEDYILTSARIKPAGTAPAADTAPRGAAAVMYKITGLDAAELKKHLNHQVELTGRLEDAAAGAAAKPSEKVKDFKATSLKMVAATCPGATN
jgi:hypothetical protein